MSLNFKLEGNDAAMRLPPKISDTEGSAIALASKLKN
jgi:hypothetical protein